MAGRRGRTAAAALLALVLVAGCGDDDASPSSSGDGGVEIGGEAGVARRPPVWDAPPPEAVAALAEAAGAPLQLHETLEHHAHSHVDVFVDGEHHMVPAAIGIVVTDPGVRRFDDLSGTAYGGIERCEQPCISSLHTHDTSGIIHTESAQQVDHTMAQLFRMWDVRLDDECIGDYCTPDTTIAIYVDGEEVPLAEAPEIALTQGKEVAIVIGEPPARIPDSADFSAA